jgi:hypothetical protein
MNRHTPLGFYLSGIVSAMFGGVMLFLVAVLELSDGHPEVMLVIRALAAGLAVLAAVATEALWFRRRWAYPATLALAVAFGATTAGALPILIGTDLPAFIVLALCAGAVAPIVLYVRARSQTLFGTPAPARARPHTAPWW